MRALPPPAVFAAALLLGAASARGELPVTVSVKTAMFGTLALADGEIRDRAVRRVRDTHGDDVGGRVRIALRVHGRARRRRNAGEHEHRRARQGAKSDSHDVTTRLDLPKTSPTVDETLAAVNDRERDGCDNLAVPGLVESTGEGWYTPHWMEAVVVLGLASAVALAYLFIVENFPIYTADDVAASEAAVAEAKARARAAKAKPRLAVLPADEVRELEHAGRS